MQHQNHEPVQVAALLTTSKAAHPQTRVHIGPDSQQKATANSKKRKAKKARRANAQTHDSTQAESMGQLNALPLHSSNIGSRMLVSMGWEAGTGLGATSQGQVEPVPVVKRHKRRGLGA